MYISLLSSYTAKVIKRMVLRAHLRWQGRANRRISSNQRNLKARKTAWPLGTAISRSLSVSGVAGLKGNGHERGDIGDSRNNLD